MMKDMTENNETQERDPKERMRRVPAPDVEQNTREDEEHLKCSGPTRGGAHGGGSLHFGC